MEASRSSPSKLEGVAAVRRPGACVPAPLVGANHHSPPYTNVGRIMIRPYTNHITYNSPSKLEGVAAVRRSGACVPECCVGANHHSPPYTDAGRIMIRPYTKLITHNS